MANVKRLTLDYSTSGLTAYIIIRREADNYRLNDADGNFALNPADPYLSITEDSVIKGRYEVNESRTAWNDGRYTVAFYQQTGGSPAPASDIVIGSEEMFIVADSEVVVNASIAAIPTNPALASDYTTARAAKLDNLDAVITSRPTLAQIEASTVLAKQAKLDFVEKWILNKLVESPPWTWTLYDDDSTTVLKTWTWNSATSTRTKAT